jgi:NAD(P)-dependent dehydrogenase (short-subunit alcohol dehydrogenase family)
LEGVSEVLAREVAPFNVKVTALAPGSFRTDWARRSLIPSPRRIVDYDALFDPVRQARAEKSGRQNGDPDRPPGSCWTFWRWIIRPSTSCSEATR